MPDVDGNAGQRLAREIGDAALHEHPFARQFGRNVGAMRLQLVLADIERAEHRGLAGAVALAMVHRVDQHGDPEHIRQQDELLPGRGAFLADPGQEFDRIIPLVEGQAGLADIAVHRLYQFFQQEFDARVWRLLKTVDHGGGEFGLIELGHLAVLRVRDWWHRTYTRRNPEVSMLPLDRDTLFGYQGGYRQPRR